jgi:hypothetical protein
VGECERSYCVCEEEEEEEEEAEELSFDANILGNGKEQEANIERLFGNSEVNSDASLFA